ncbi:MAG TPA: DUF6036 family nucleotidyltransferase [Tepidisphaeraceae bacterium]|jgi:hypothetical protein
MAATRDSLWAMVMGPPEVDPGRLAEAVRAQLGAPDLDFRTRMLIRESVNALQEHWNPPRVKKWLESCPQRATLEEILRTDFEQSGFSLLKERLVEATKPEDVADLLRELSRSVHQPTRLIIGGSIALILTGNLSRHTEDIDVVNEVPAEIRNQHGLLADLAKRYGIKVAHFQSHYLPDGWEKRTHLWDTIGKLHVALVDVYDIFVGKLFSVRPKDRDDLRMLREQLDKEIIVQRLLRAGDSLRKEARMVQFAKDTWFILFGEEMPE